jgi:hypothetical protein
MKVRSMRRAVVPMACPVCHKPARRRPPTRWTTADGARPAWSRLDGGPLCAVPGEGTRPVRRGWIVTTLRPTRRTVQRSASRSAHGDATVYLVAGGDMVAVFDNAHAASIQYHVMVGANLDTYTRRVTAAWWEIMRAELATDDGITIVDVRLTRRDDVQ